MKNFIFVILLCSISVVLFGQTISLQQGVDFTEAKETGIDVTTDGNGNSFVLGQIALSNYGRSFVTILGFNNSDQLVWQQTLSNYKNGFGVKILYRNGFIYVLTHDLEGGRLYCFLKPP